VSDEVFDHTSLLQFCERWTTARGRGVPASLPPWRRRLVGDLVNALTFDDPPPELAGLDGPRFARPAPYFPVVELELDDEGVTLRLGNLGPTARLVAPFVVDDGRVSQHTVEQSSLDDPRWVEVPVDVRSGTYDVTVLGPGQFSRRFAGSFPSPVRCTCEHFGAGDAWFPDLALTVSHSTTVPTFFWLQRRLGTRFGGATSERLLGPRRTASFREEPGARTHGWYDLSVTTSADPAWIQEYAGHLHAGNRPSPAEPLDERH
jgi:phospholipase C